MATTRPAEGPITVEEFERMSLDGFWELIDGELVELSPAGGIPARVANLVAYFVTANVLAGNLGRVYGPEGGFVLFPNRKLVRSPDLAFIRADRVPPDAEQVGFLRVVPDLAVEVRSPSDRMPPLQAKVNMYLQAGVRLVWLIDPGARTIGIFTQVGPVALLREGDVLDGSDVLPGFRLAVDKLFA